MNYYFVTGASRGLGKSLVTLLLRDESNIVYGFSRGNTISHERYTHTTINLSDVNSLQSFEFPGINNPNKIILINNAGILGDIKHVGNIDSKKIVEVYNVNLIAPVLLSNSFIKQYGTFAVKKIVVNISSGAGQYPIDGWSTYCSTKAGIDMFTQVMHEESVIDNSNVEVVSLAPGIIDTEMQTSIRESNQEDFSNVSRFISYKDDSELVSPELTAEKVLKMIEIPSLRKGVVCSVRDL